MENNILSSKSFHLLMVLLLLCIFLCLTESALPFRQELLINGRRMMSYYKPNIIGTPSSTSQHGPVGNGRRLMSQMDVGASSSGQGGGKNRH